MNHLRFLKYFDEVVRSGSIRQAAERLHVAPSAVNRRILDLEEELGVALFERLPRGMRLTAAGELFVSYVRNRQSDLEKVRSEIEELKGLRRGSIKLVASQALVPAVMPKAIADFRRKHPLVEFKVHIGDHVQALKSLRNFEADLALVFNLGPEADIEIMARHEQKLMAIMHHSHPLAGSTTGLRLRDCLDYPLVLPNRDLGGRQLIETYLARGSLHLHATIESNSFEFLRACLQYEQALSFQIALGVVSDGGNFVAQDIHDRGFPSGHLVLARLRCRQTSVISQAFTEHLKNSLESPTPQLV